MEQNSFLWSFIAFTRENVGVIFLAAITIGLLLGYWVRRKTKVEFPKGDELNQQLQFELDSKMKTVHCYFSIIVLYLNGYYKFDENSLWLDRKGVNSTLIIVFFVIVVAERFFFLHLLRKKSPPEN